MSLKVKFNLILLLTGMIGIGITALIAFNIQRDNARTEALETAAVLLESALAVRNYTVEEVRPLIAAQSAQRFLPQTVPAYAAASYIENLRAQHPNYDYKEAALNPTNPSNRAADWEADIIHYFRSHKDAGKMVGERETPTGRSLYLSKPIRISNQKCLICHSTPSAAPDTMIERYGNSNGFGWKHNEIIGAQIVSVPLSLPLARAKEEFIVFMSALLGVFFCIGVVLNLLLKRYVIHPVTAMASHVDKVSMGTLDMPELTLTGNDEIASLGRSFNRMQRSLDSAVKMLEEEE
ncbi:MAG: c-type heme family protein [Pseudomonadales bacterium]